MGNAYCLIQKTTSCVCTKCILPICHCFILSFSFLHSPSTEHDAQQASHFQPVLKISEGEDIYDFAWFPFMRSEGNYVAAEVLTFLDPSTCAFLSTSRDHPIHLWDAYTGRSRTSYVAYDDADEPSAAYSLCFNPTGDK